MWHYLMQEAYNEIDHTEKMNCIVFTEDGNANMIVK